MPTLALELFVDEGTGAGTAPGPATVGLAWAESDIVCSVTVTCVKEGPQVYSKTAININKFARKKIAVAFPFPNVAPKNGPYLYLSRELKAAMQVASSHHF